MGTLRICIVILPMLLSVAALVLGILLMVPSSGAAVIEDIWFLRLNTSNIVVGGNGQVNAAINTVAQTLGLSDFYTSSMLGYCQGTYDDPTDPNSAATITNCSAPSLSYAFNPVQTFEEQVSVPVSFLVPDEVNAALSKVAVLSQGMIIAFLGGTIATGVEVITGLFAFSSKCGSCVTLLFGLAGLAMYIAGAVIVSIMFPVLNGAINDKVSEFGVISTLGTTPTAMAWAAAALNAAAVILWITSLFISSRKKSNVVYTPMTEYRPEFPSKNEYPVPPEHASISGSTYVSDGYYIPSKY